MRSVAQCFSEGYKTAMRVAFMAFIPLTLDLLSLPGRLAQLPHNAESLGFRFSMPVYLPSLSNVYNFPTASNNVQIGTSPIPSSEPIVSIMEAIVFSALIAFLAGGYLGTMDAKRKGATTIPPFFRMCSVYFKRLFGFALLWLFVISPAALLAVSGLSGLVVPYVLLVFVLDYFLFLTPFAIVVDGDSLQVALSKSIIIAGRKASSVLPYVIIYAIFTAVISFMVYALMNAQVMGYVLDAVLYAFLGTILVSSTLVFYSEVSSPPNSSISISSETQTGNHAGSNPGE